MHRGKLGQVGAAFVRGHGQPRTDSAWTWGRPSVMLAKEKSTSPAITAVVDGAPPLNGMCTASVPVRAWNSSTE